MITQSNTHTAICTSTAVRVVWKAKIQSHNSEKERRRRIERPSLLFTDIQNLLQLAKVQTALARVPSFSLQSSPRLNKISSSVMETYNKRRVFGKKISAKLTKLQEDYMNFGNESFTAASDLYDRITRLSQDITTTINSEKRNYSNRYLNHNLNTCPLFKCPITVPLFLT